MPVSDATNSLDDLWTQFLAQLDGLGYSWNRNTTSLEEYLATAAVGLTGNASITHLNTSLENLVAAIAGDIDSTTYSSLTYDVDDLMVLALNA